MGTAHTACMVLSTVWQECAVASEGLCHMCRRAGNGTFRRGILIPSGGTTLINHAYATISVGVLSPVHLIMSSVGE